ncbi:MAG: sigma-70 family RNA polymerase sigma factor [Planctomycetota bacterium]
MNQPTDPRGFEPPSPPPPPTTPTPDDLLPAAEPPVMDAATRNAPDEAESRALLAKFAGGSDVALGKLLERERSWLLRRIRSRLPRGVVRRVGGSDILQLTAINVMAARQRFNDQGLPAFRRFVATVADRVLADELKRESAQKRDWERQVHRAAETSAPGSDPLEQIAALQTSPSEAVMRQEHLGLIKECFRKLGALDRTIIRMIDYEQVSYEDTSRILDISQDAARQRHHRAVARLRSMVQREL